MARRQQQALAAQRQRRQARVRARAHGTPSRPRLAVYRSIRHIHAQLIDDVHGRTLVAAADTELQTMPPTALERARAVGALLAKKAFAQHIQQAVFDRRSYKYHGRVKALAEGVRSEGLTI